MHRFVILFICISVLLVVSTISVKAEREVIVRPVDPDAFVETIMGPEDPSSTCQVGNLTGPVWSVDGFLLPPEEFGLIFQTWGTCSECMYGFSVAWIHVMFETTEACDITIAMDVEQAQLIAPGCWGPGVEWCNTGPTVVPIPDAGYWDVTLSIACPCLAHQVYLLSLEIDSYDCATESMPALVTNDSPLLCYNWNNIGTGWYDIFAQWPTWPGNLSFWATASCCSPPVPTEERTWGAIKSLYRR